MSNRNRNQQTPTNTNTEGTDAMLTDTTNTETTNTTAAAAADKPARKSASKSERNRSRAKKRCEYCNRPLDMFPECGEGRCAVKESGNIPDDDSPSVRFARDAAPAPAPVATPEPAPSPAAKSEPAPSPPAVQVAADPVPADSNAPALVAPPVQVDTADVSTSEPAPVVADVPTLPPLCGLSVHLDGDRPYVDTAAFVDTLFDPSHPAHKLRGAYTIDGARTYLDTAALFTMLAATATVDTLREIVGALFRVASEPARIQALAAMRPVDTASTSEPAPSEPSKPAPAPSRKPPTPPRSKPAQATLPDVDTAKPRAAAKSPRKGEDTDATRTVGNGKGATPDAKSDEGRLLVYMKNHHRGEDNAGRPADICEAVKIDQRRGRDLMKKIAAHVGAKGPGRDRWWWAL